MARRNGFFTVRPCKHVRLVRQGEGKFFVDQVRGHVSELINYVAWDQDDCWVAHFWNVAELENQYVRDTIGLEELEAVMDAVIRQEPHLLEPGFTWNDDACPDPEYGDYF